MPRNQWICKICISNELEDWEHFVFKCPSHLVPHHILLNKVKSSDTEFESMTNLEKLHILYQKDVVLFAKYISDIWNMRKALLYKHCLILCHYMHIKFIFTIIYL